MTPWCGIRSSASVNWAICESWREKTPKRKRRHPHLLECLGKPPGPEVQIPRHFEGPAVLGRIAEPLGLHELQRNHAALLRGCLVAHVQMQLCEQDHG